MAQEFTLTEDHVKLLRRFYVAWCHDEYGAPEIDPKRPYGNSDVDDDIAEILGIQPESGNGHGDRQLSPGQRDHVRRIHLETQTALQIVLRTGSMEPGEYVAPDYSVDWRRRA